MYSARRIKIWNVVKLIHVSNILYKCGKDMAKKYDLHHWDNSHFKNYVIVALCALKNQIYLVYNNKTPVATFQTRRNEQSFLFQKLATSPEFAGAGIGTYCINEIEKLAKNHKCKEVVCEVYDKSQHALGFYLNKGYVVYDKADTLKYSELKLRKEL